MKMLKITCRIASSSPSCPQTGFGYADFQFGVVLQSLHPPTPLYRDDRTRSVMVEADYHFQEANNERLKNIG
jgi:hypothetical protein